MTHTYARRASHSPHDGPVWPAVVLRAYEVCLSKRDVVRKLGHADLGRRPACEHDVTSEPAVTATSSVGQSHDAHTHGGCSLMRDPWVTGSDTGNAVPSWRTSGAGPGGAQPLFPSPSWSVGAAVASPRLLFSATAAASCLSSRERRALSRSSRRALATRRGSISTPSIEAQPHDSAARGNRAVRRR